jgi:AcrR family transcriptional regulator
VPDSSQARAGARRRAGTRRDLLDATVRLLDAGASHATLSIADISREAAVSRATFYGHFRDRTELIVALAEDQIAWLTVAGRPAPPPADPEEARPLSREAVRGSVATLVAGWQERRPVLSSIIEVAEHDAAIRRLWVGGIHEVAEVACQVFVGHWRSGGGEAPDDALVVSEALTWMIERSCHQMLSGRTEPEQVVDALTEIVCRVVGVD